MSATTGEKPTWADRNDEESDDETVTVISKSVATTEAGIQQVYSEKIVTAAKNSVLDFLSKTKTKFASFLPSNLTFYYASAGVKIFAPHANYAILVAHCETAYDAENDATEWQYFLNLLFGNDSDYGIFFETATFVAKEKPFSDLKNRSSVPTTVRGYYFSPPQPEVVLAPIPKVQHDAKASILNFLKRLSSIVCCFKEGLDFNQRKTTLTIIDDSNAPTDAFAILLDSMPSENLLDFLFGAGHTFSINVDTWSLFQLDRNPDGTKKTFRKVLGKKVSGFGQQTNIPFKPEEPKYLAAVKRTQNVAPSLGKLPASFATQKVDPSLRKLPPATQKVDPSLGELIVSSATQKIAPSFGELSKSSAIASSLGKQQVSIGTSLPVNILEMSNEELEAYVVTEEAKRIDLLARLAVLNKRT